MGIYLPLLCVGLIASLHQFEADASRDPSSSFKLSDLPVLKRSEIPGKYTKARLGYVGRRHKDLGRDMKRSVYWELKPDFSANEIDWYDDPAKIRSDFNYKSFLEGLGSDDGDGDDVGDNGKNVGDNGKNVIDRKSVVKSNIEGSNDSDGKKEINIMLENQAPSSSRSNTHAQSNTTGALTKVEAGKIDKDKRNGRQKSTKSTTPSKVIAAKREKQKDKDSRKTVKSAVWRGHKSNTTEKLTKVEAVKIKAENKSAEKSTKAATQKNQKITTPKTRKTRTHKVHKNIDKKQQTTKRSQKTTARTATRTTTRTTTKTATRTTTRTATKGKIKNHGSASTRQKAEKRDRRTNTTIKPNETSETLKSSSNISNTSAAEANISNTSAAEANAINTAKSSVDALNATMSRFTQNLTADAANTTMASAGNTTLNSTLKDKVEEMPRQNTNKTDIVENGTLSLVGTGSNNSIAEGAQKNNTTMSSTTTTNRGKKKSLVSSHHTKKRLKHRSSRGKSEAKKRHSRRRRRSLDDDDDEEEFINNDKDDECNEDNGEEEETRQKRELSENRTKTELDNGSATTKRDEFENSHLHGGSRFKRSPHRPKLNANKKYFDHLLTQSTNVAVSRITRLNKNGSTTAVKEPLKQKRLHKSEAGSDNTLQVSKRGLEQLFSPSVQNLISKFKMHQLLTQNNPFSPANLPSATNEPQKAVAKATVPSSSSFIASLIPVAQSIIGPNLFSSAFSGGAGGKSPIENALDIVKRQNNYHPVQQAKKSTIMEQQNLYGNQKKNNMSSLLQDVHNLYNKAPSTQQRSELAQQQSKHRSASSELSPDLHLMLNEFHKRNLMQLMGKIPLKNLTHIFTRSRMNNQTNFQMQDGGATAQKHLEVPRINLPPLSIPRIHLPAIQPSITRLGTTMSNGAHRLKNEMKQKANNNKNLFRGKKADVPEHNNTDDSSENKKRSQTTTATYNDASTKKGDGVLMHSNEGEREMLRSFIHSNNHPSLALFLKRLEKGEEGENIVDVSSKRSKTNENEAEHHESEAANVIEKVLNHKKVLDDVELERRSLHDKMNAAQAELKSSDAVDVNVHKGGEHTSQEWKRQKESNNNNNKGEQKPKYEVYNAALGKRNQKLDHFLKSLDGKKSHEASGEKRGDFEQQQNHQHHHSPEQQLTTKLSKNTPSTSSTHHSSQNSNSNVHHHWSGDVTSPIATSRSNNNEHESRNSIRHHPTPSKNYSPDFVPSQKSDGIKFKSEDVMTSSESGGKPHEATSSKKESSSRRSSLPHSRILAIAKMAIENPQLLTKIQRAAAEMNKKSDIPTGSGNDPSLVGSIIPSINLQDKRARKTEVTHFNGESSPQAAAQTQQQQTKHAHHKKQEIQNAESAKSEKKDGEDESEMATKDFVAPSSFAATDDITRAVSVAMHQLKRDRMYGEVYVRVHPGGKIRVMVQETRPQE